MGFPGFTKGRSGFGAFRGAGFLNGRRPGAVLPQLTLSASRFLKGTAANAPIATVGAPVGWTVTILGNSGVPVLLDTDNRTLKAGAAFSAVATGSVRLRAVSADGQITVEQLFELAIYEDVVTPPGGSVGIFGFARPTSEPNRFADLVTTLDQAEINDTSIWTRQSNDAALSFSGGRGVVSGAQTALRALSITPPGLKATGRRLASVAYLDATNGNVVIGGVNVASSITGAKSKPGRYMSGLTVTDGSAAFSARASFSSGVAGSLESLHVFDLDALLLKKWFLIHLISQSNFVGAACTLDPSLDLPAYGTAVIPGAGNTSSGWEVDANGIGKPALTVDPVMHTLLNTGGGPTGAFMRELRKHIPEDYTPVFVATGANGAGFGGNGLWNKDGTTRTAYENFWRQTRGAWTMAPAGSVVGGIVFCQGEADIGSGQMAEWDLRAPALLQEVQNEPGWNAPKGGGASFGRIPIVFAEMGYNLVPGTSDAPTIANTQNMIDLQKKYATGSGDARALPRCKYVPRPANSQFEADNVHFNQATNRQRGVDVAQALASLIYPA